MDERADHPLWDVLMGAWPFDGSTCGFCWAEVHPSNRRRHADWHVASMPDAMWERFASTTAAGLSDLLRRS